MIMNMPPDVPLSKIPLQEPPAGITSNFVDPQSRAPAVLAVNAVMMVWALSFVIIRLFANTQAPRNLQIEDYSCIIATILAVSFTGLTISLNKFARHEIDIPLVWFNSTYWKLNYVETILIGPTLFFAKSAILFLYLRIFIVSRKMRYTIWFGLIWNFLLYWSGIPIVTYYCTPRIGKPWDPFAIAITCANFKTYTVIQSVLSVALDLYIFVLPIPIVLKLQMSLKKRLSVLGIFGTALLGITVAVVALVYRVKLYISDYDSLWKAAVVYICISCEDYVAIIVSSMPAVASVRRGRFSVPHVLAGMRGRLLSKSRFAVSRSEGNDTYQSRPGIYSSDEAMIASHHERDGDYLRLSDSHRAEDYELGLVETENEGAVDDPSIEEEGVVRKNIAVHQSITQARPAT